MKTKIIPLIFSLLCSIGIAQTTESEYDAVSVPICGTNVHGSLSAHMDCSSGILVTSFLSDGADGTVVKGLVSSTDYVLITPGHSFVKFVPDNVPLPNNNHDNNHDHQHRDHQHRDIAFSPSQTEGHKTSVGVPPPPPPPPPTGGRTANIDDSSKSITLVANSEQNLVTIVTSNKDINSFELYNSHGSLILSRKVKTKSDFTIATANLKDKFYIIKFYGYKDEIIIKKFINR